MRAYSGYVIVIAFLLWFLYRLLIKKDLRQHTQDLYAALFFTGIWAVIYYALRSYGALSSNTSTSATGLKRYTAPLDNSLHR